jgi:hypothetical protein
LHLRVPDLGVSSPKTYHLGYIPRWAAGKTPTDSDSKEITEEAEEEEAAIARGRGNG